MMQSKDISTLNSMRALSAGVVNLRQLEQAFPDVPRKVIHAKYRALFRNWLLDDGCDCGCSTHARITDKGRKLIQVQCPPDTAHDATQRTTGNVHSPSPSTASK